MPKSDIEAWLIEQRKRLDELKDRKKKEKSKEVDMPKLWAPDPPMRRFPTSSGELWYGRVPTYQTLAKLRDMGVSVIWNLGLELAMFVPHERAYVEHVIQGNVPDYGVPSNPMRFLAQAQEVVDRLKAGEIAFLHCHGGVGRSSMALATIQLLMSNDTGEQALQKANAAANGPDTEVQEEFVQRIASYLKRPAPKKSVVPKTKDIVSKEQAEIDKIINRYEQLKKKTEKQR